VPRPTWIDRHSNQWGRHSCLPWADKNVYSTVPLDTLQFRFDVVLVCCAYVIIFLKRLEENLFERASLGPQVADLLARGGGERP
jgi:hypothetical protein